MSPVFNDTIAAIATPPGHGGIAVLRVSGPDAETVLLRIFKPELPIRLGPPTVEGASASVPGAWSFRPRYLHYGQALDASGEPLDEVLAVFMPGPASFTGENTGEIHCHGGPAITAALLESAFAAGARAALPGEFTRRAFLNDKMDLTQAEAVAELISAPTREGARLARAKLRGALGQRVYDVREALLLLRAQITVAVDFPDEETELLPREVFAEALAAARTDIFALLAGYERARLWREGASVVLAGCVNAGKSSLLNALLGRPRALVSPQPGTTRDYIEETLNLDGLPVRLVDTAGLRSGGGVIGVNSEEDGCAGSSRARPSVDAVEEEGMRLAHDLAAEADLLVLVVDIAKGMSHEDREFCRRYAEIAAQGRVLVAFNKMDFVNEALPLPELSYPAVGVSAKTGQGVDELAAGIREALLRTQRGRGAAPEQGDVAPNLRQSRLLREADEELEALARDMEAGMPPDILGVRLETAALLLGEVLGASGTEEVLDRVFSSFCIGK